MNNFDKQEENFRIKLIEALSSMSTHVNWWMHNVWHKKLEVVLKSRALIADQAWPQGYKTFFMLGSSETKFILLINVKMPIIVGILTFMSRINYRLLGSKPEILIYLGYFSIY